MSYLTIYKASAGSGKTFTLAAKYTAFLLSGEDRAHARLLAVTFTNKATGEMKERILEKLYSIAYGNDSEDGFLKEVQKHLDEKTKALGTALLRKRAQERLSSLVHDYDHFSVQTIDAFFQSLLSNLAHELGLAANFKVQINDAEVFSRAVDNIMSRISAPDLKDAADVQLRKWVTDFIREQLEDDRSWKISDGLKSFARQLFSDAYVDNEEELEKKLGDSALMNSYKAQLKQQIAHQKDQLKQVAQQVHAELLQLGGSADVATAYDELFGKRGHSWYWGYVSKSIEGVCNKEASATIKKTIDSGSEAGRLLGRLEEVRESAEVLINSLELALSNINKLRLLGEIAKETKAINEEENHFMLAKTPVLFDQLIGDDDAPFAMERAGNRFEHIMIDEFQDTSTRQWRNFERLLINNIAQGQECLLVGDVKQGIYRWRGGDWNKLNELSELNKNTTHSLDRNFRSADVIIDFNNAVFTTAPSLLGAPWPDDAHQEKSGKPGGYVRLSFNAEELFEDVAEQIRQLMEVQGIALSDMAILLRRNTDANEMIEYFRQHHPDLLMVSSEAFFLKSSSAVQKLVAALRYLRDVGREDKYRDRISETYLSQHAALPEEFVSRKVELLRKPLYELCETLIDLFQLATEEEEVPFVFYFLDQVLEYLEEHPSNLREFLRYWDESLSRKSIPGGEVPGIRILSIHKSKGLAFHTVLMPFCNWTMEEDRLDNILWCSSSKAPFNLLPALPISQQKKMEHSEFSEEYTADHQAQLIENLNLLYVAFTRAQQNLLVWGKTSRGSKQSAGLLLNVVEAIPAEKLRCTEQSDARTKGNAEAPVVFTYGEMALQKRDKQRGEEAPNPFVYQAKEEEVSFGHTNLNLRFRQSSRVRDFLISDSAPECGSQCGESNAEGKANRFMAEGTLLHDVFSRIRTADDIDAALLSVQQEGLVDAAWVEHHRALVTARITSPRTREWFSSRWQVFNEQAIICPHPTRPILTTRRPDRVITDGERTIVIDFKFARHDADHVLQVENYCRLLREMGYPGVEGYLWYVYPNEVVEIGN